ncbi:MAG: FAD:protein FMN transferase [Acidobacteriota bacterium]
MYRRREILQPGRVRPTAAGGYWLHVSRPAMACRFEVTLPDEVESGVREASLALDEVGRIESRLSIFREESEITRLNRLAGRGPIEVDPDIFDLLVRCRDLSLATEGVFDITTGPLSRVWGFTRRAGRVPSGEELEAARRGVGMGRLGLDHAKRTVSFGGEGMEVNPGGVGKGYALDQVAARLRRHRIPALISAGYSSMLALGQIWTVGVRDPRCPVESGRRLAVIRIRDLALGTSGSEEQSFEFEGVRYGHIIDPRTGWPAPAGLGVTVIAPSAELADGLATAFYVGGARLASQYCAAHPGVVVVMLEQGIARPLVIGENPQCEVTILNE